MSSQYSSLALCYDKLNSDINYTLWAEKIDKTLKKYGVPSGSLLLDLACGTGSITLPLSRLGYDMIGVDLSPEMLDMARSKSGGRDILWLCQDMRDFELYGTVAATVCCLDSINYILRRDELEMCFSLVHNYLDCGGIFIFDVNSPYKFQNIYKDNHYILEADGVYCGWQNSYNKKSGICHFDLSIFAKMQDGLWQRFDELQREKCYSQRVLTSCLEKTGFEILSVCSDVDSGELSCDTERIFFCCRAIK